MRMENMAGARDRCFPRRAALAWNRVAIAYFILLSLAGTGIAFGTPVERPHFAVIGAIPANAGLWDYAAVDPESRRLYLADGGVLALDLATRQVTPRLVRGNLTHGIVPLGHDIVAVADGTHREVVLFEGKTGRILWRIRTGDPPSADDWHNPDAMLLEPKTGELIAANGDSGTLALIDLRRNVVAGVIRVGGKLEFAAAGNNGIVYVNVESRNQLAVIDVPARRVLRRIPLPRCEEPTGLAYDPEFDLIISACSNGVAEFLRAETGHLAAQVRIGKGCDAVVLDATRGLVYFPAADSGSLSIVALRDPGKIHVAQRLRTAPGVRLGAVDPATGILYLPAVRYDLAAPRIRLPGLPALPAPVAGSFRFLMVARQR
jgi:DNA-binding beta-propeller fold protein YncE